MHRLRRHVPWLILFLAPAGSQAAAIPGDFLYHAQPRDTLIGIGRRLLLEPRRWHDVQSLNHIADPRRIPPDSILRIPYEWLRVSPQTATVVGVAGTVQEAGRKIAVGDVLSQGAVIETGADGSVTLDLADGSVITLQKSSVLKLDEMVQVSGVAADSIRLKLDSGRIESKVKPHRDVGRFEIITPAAVSAVRGTQFRDSFEGSDLHATTETLEGAVGVSAGAATVPVAAGFGTRVDQGHAPLAPVVLLPPPSLTDQPQIHSTALLHVQLPSVPGARQYRLQLAADSSFHALTADVLSADGTANISDLPDGDYWLRARSVDPLGLEGPDAVRHFTQHTLPEPPRPMSPASGAKIAGPHIHLAWTGAPTSQRYTLQVAGDADFGSPVVVREQLDAPDADVDELPPGRYCWRVAAVNARGESGPWSAVQSYTQRPLMPVPDAPLVGVKTVSFRWAQIPGESYRAQIARSANFAHPVLDQRIDVADWSVPKLFPGTYYMRVQSIDADGSAAPFSAPRRFVVPVPLWVKIAAPLAIGLAFLL